MAAAAAADPRRREGFLEAARAAASLRHPGIETVCDCGSEQDVPYLVTEYVESRPLSEHLARLHAPSRVGDPAVRRWVREVAAALDHAHGLGVAHGEVGPESVLVRSGDGRAVLGGVALAAARGSLEPAPAGDVQAFAGMLYEIATGTPAPSRALAAIGGHPERPLPPLTLHGRPLPAELEAALQRGLAGAQEAGQGSAGALAAAYLEATERSLPALPAPSPAMLAPARPALPARARPAVRRTGWTLAPVAVVLLGAGALLGLSAAAAAPPAAGMPPPVHAALGDQMTVGGVRLAVLGVERGAAPPGLSLGPGDEFVTVTVDYRPRTGATLVSPYDWVVTDASGAAYGAIPVGLREVELPRDAGVRGSVGFVVPLSAPGLVLHYDAELGDGAAEVPLG